VTVVDSKGYIQYSSGAIMKIRLHKHQGAAVHGLKDHEQKLLLDEVAELTKNTSFQLEKKYFSDTNPLAAILLPE